MLVSIFYIIVRGSIKHKFINIIIIIIVGLGAWEVINMPLLEKTGGRTLTRILNTGANIGVFDESFFTGEDPTGGRDVFFMDGIRYFIKSPIWGHGINNYRILNGQDTGIYTYSHNTFIELLVGVGPLGIILFYSLFYMLGKMLINSQIENSIKVQFGSFFLIYLFFIGMGQEVTFDPSLFMVVTLAMGEINFGNIRNKNIPEFL